MDLGLFFGHNKITEQGDCAAYIGIGGMKIEDEPRH